MNTDIKARYRNKLKKVIIEVWNGEKWIYVKTLLDPLVEFRQECLAKVSLKQVENTQKDAQTFAQDKLCEPTKIDTLARIIPTEEQMRKLLEMTKE